MSKATDTSIAEEAKPSGDNVSMDDLIAQRTRLYTEPEAVEQPEEEVQAEPEAVEDEQVEASEEMEEQSEVTEEDEPTAEETTEEAEESEETEEAEDTASGNEIDIEAVMGLEPEQIQELATKGKTRLLSRIGELTARAKAAESEVEQLKAAGPAPASASSDIPEPIRQLDTPEKVEQAMEGYEQTLDITRKVLREKSDYDADDVVYEANGESYTKAQLEAAEEGAIKALSKHLPRQSKHLKDVAKYKQTNEMWFEQAKKEVPEIQDEESEIGSAYAQLMSNPNVAKLKELSPELTVDLEYIFAHAVNSIKGGQKPKATAKAGSKLKIKPSASPVGSGAATSKRPVRGRAVETYGKFEESGSAEDWVAARIARASGH